MIEKQNARQIFGGLLKFHREARGYNLRRVAHLAHVSQGDVEAWESGRVVPTSQQWERLIQRMQRSLRGLAEQYKAARTEDESERTKITGAMTMINGHGQNGQNGQRASIGTNLGERITQATAIKPSIEVTRPAPAEPTKEPEATMASPTERRGSDGRALPPKVPTGAKTIEAMRLREEFVRNMLRQRPAIKYGGDDGLGALLHQRFGIGVTPQRVNAIREEVQAERARGGAIPVRPVVEMVDLPAINALRDAAPARAPEPKPTETTDSDLETAVSLVLEAIPGLREFTITVDDNGEASVDFKVREVKITERGGSLKVRR